MKMNQEIPGRLVLKSRVDLSNLIPPAPRRRKKAVKKEGVKRAPTKKQASALAAAQPDQLDEMVMDIRAARAQDQEFIVE